MMKIDEKEWIAFTVENIFSEIKATKGKTTGQLVKGDDVPYIAAAKTNNGFAAMCSSKEHPEWVSDGNAIVFVQLGDGAAGLAHYIPMDFIGMSGKTSSGYNSELSEDNGVFIARCLSSNKAIFSHGHSWTGRRLLSTKTMLDEIEAKIKQDTPNDESLKILMITHKVLATQQGYEELLNVLGDGLRNKEDPFLLFFMNTVEPIYKALCTSNTQLLFDTLDIKRYPITRKSEKAKWQEFRKQLAEARTQKAIDVLELVRQTDLIPMPPNLDGYYCLYHDAPESMYIAEVTIRSFLELEYSQFLAAIDFLYPEAVFSTEHGVKGEEYDNVVFVISKGWNQYQFETYAPMITGLSPIPEGKEASYERNRNLFYVCCSRPKKRLFLFVTVPIEAAFRAFLITLVGEDNIITYQQFMKTTH